jgi:hypothetical protein
LVNPYILLFCVFLIGAGFAFHSPTWSAIVPDVVTDEELPSAALHEIRFPDALLCCRRIQSSLHGSMDAVFLNHFEELVVIAVIHRKPNDNRAAMVQRFLQDRSYLIRSQIIRPVAPKASAERRAKTMTV